MTNPNPRHLLPVLAIAAVALAGCADTQKAVIPAGTTLVATLNGPLSTAANRAGDPFLATIRQPLQAPDDDSGSWRALAHDLHRPSHRTL